MRGRRPPRTLRWLLARYLEERILRPATAEMYAKTVETWIRDTGKPFLKDVTRRRALQWRRQVLSRASPETWNKHRRQMRALLAFAIRQGYRRGRNPFDEVGPAPAPQRLPRTVDLDDLAAIVDHLESGRSRLRPAWLWAMIVRALYLTGVRRRQLVGLRWGDVSIDRGTWLMRAETSKTRREYLVPLAREVIEDLVELRRRTALKRGRPPFATEQVYNVCLFYPRYKGPELTEPQLTQTFARLSKETGIRISPHRLRHTAATQIVQIADLESARYLLGHSSLQTTMRYVHPSMSYLKTLVDEMPVTWTRRRPRPGHDSR